MKIRFTCSCGKSYSVDPKFSGRKVKCKKCDNVVRVPAAVVEEIVDAIIDDEPPIASPVATHDAIGLGSAGSATAPMNQLESRAHRKPVQYSATAQKLMAEHKANEANQPYTAANPALLKPSIVKHVTTFPHRFAWRAGMLLLFIGLSFLHWIAIPFVLLMAYMIFRYLRELRSNFVSGLICPTKILSVNPPILATYVDQSVGQSSCHVIRLYEQPLRKLPAQLATPRRCAAVCYFYGMYPGLSDHWFMPLPTLPELVSSDNVEVQRINQSITDHSWNMLEMGLKQLPPNAELRTYRIIRPDFQPRLTISSKAELSLIANPLLKEGRAKVANEITPESLEAANKVSANPLNLADVVAVADSYVVMTSGIFFLKAKPASFINWKDIKVAYVNFNDLEIVRTDGKRVVIDVDFIRAGVQLEKLINRVVGVGFSD